MQEQTEEQQIFYERASLVTTIHYKSIENRKELRRLLSSNIGLCMPSLLPNNMLQATNLSKENMVAFRL